MLFEDNNKQGVLGTLNPLAKLAACVFVAGILLFMFTLWTLLILLCLEIIFFFLSKLSLKRFFFRIMPLFLAVLATVIVNFLYSDAATTQEAILLGISVGLRIIVVTLPLMILFSDVSALQLADAFEQVLRVPARFVMTSFASLRMASLFMDDWAQLSRTERSRGVQRSWVGNVKKCFAIFVMALGRASTLSHAMEVRALGYSNKRTWTRISKWRMRDNVFLCVWMILIACALFIPIWLER